MGTTVSHPCKPPYPRSPRPARPTTPSARRNAPIRFPLSAAEIAKTSNFACAKTIWNITLQSLLRLAQKPKPTQTPNPHKPPGPYEPYKYGAAAKGRASQVSQHSQSVPRWTNLARTIS